DRERSRQHHARDLDCRADRAGSSGRPRSVTVRRLLVLVLALAGCSESSTAPPTACAGRPVHYRVAAALMETEGAACEPTGEPGGAWTCSCPLLNARKGPGTNPDPPTGAANE